jgi:hypothetical protein
MSTQAIMQQLSDEELRAKAAHELIAAEVAAAEPAWTHKTPVWNDLGEKTMKLYLESDKLAKEDLTAAHLEARYLRNKWWYNNKKSSALVPAVLAVVEAPVLVVEAPVATVSVVITAPLSTQIDVTVQCAGADEVVEVLNFNWRPTPAPRRFKFKYYEGIDALRRKEADRDSKTFTEEQRNSMKAAARSMTETEAIAYAKKEGYKVITQTSAGCRFYFKGGNKSNHAKFNYTAQQVDEDIKRQHEKKNNNEEYKDKFRNARVWVLE